MSKTTPPPAPAGRTRRTDRPSPRDRLLDAAAELFYRQGVGIGIDALCKAAGVSKRSMYQLFDSKDEVLAAALERRGPQLMELLVPPADGPQDPRARLLYVFERLEEEAVAPGFHGCPYLSTQVELKDPGHPASVVAARGKQGLTDFFRAEAERGGAADPERLARQLTLVYDGASARAGIGADSLEGLAAATAASLIDTAGIGR
ncbi:transcriptional regulator, TetR family [Streptomyces sp. DvalAA-14]|uniref:TetR/AcrR family transcriptional regulator n=1 Tax=unclassified Streptomyces TaxID=2593676 RepID=UPI00081B7CBA|nr:MULTISPECIES: TetR/AcrR family transcriptional regulator [unclassified Streptomyces]MYS19808.1 TetR family transcriptional regulator [Streptomyces sp. SID4948]SCD53872.1 transcriptional regulator, TetR family [Streptomyces sp. DvalAA-14]